MVVDKQTLDDLAAKAQENPRLRMAMDLRNSPEDLSQRMLNAMEPGTVMPIHRHRASSEIVVVIRERSVGYSMTRMATRQSVFYLTRMAKTACLW